MNVCVCSFGLICLICTGNFINLFTFLNLPTVSKCAYITVSLCVCVVQFFWTSLTIYFVNISASSD